MKIATAECPEETEMLKRMHIKNLTVLAFRFPDGWTASKYDDWSFYRMRMIVNLSPSRLRRLLNGSPGTHNP